MKRFRVTGHNGVVLGVFKAASQLDAWRQCCRDHGIEEGARAKSIEPGVTITEVKEEEFKPTHVVIKNGREIPVVREVSSGFPNLEIFYTREEWLEHSATHWDRVDGKKVRYSGKEQAYVDIKEIGK